MNLLQIIKYKLSGLMADIGGIMGLILGLNILDIVRCFPKIFRNRCFNALILVKRCYLILYILLYL